MSKIESNTWLVKNSQSKMTMQKAYNKESRWTYLKGSATALPDMIVSALAMLILFIGKMITLGRSPSINHLYQQEKHHVAAALITLPLGIFAAIYPPVAEMAPDWLIEKDRIGVVFPPSEEVDPYWFVRKKSPPPAAKEMPNTSSFRVVDFDSDGEEDWVAPDPTLIFENFEEPAESAEDLEARYQSQFRSNEKACATSLPYGSYDFPVETEAQELEQSFGWSS